MCIIVSIRVAYCFINVISIQNGIYSCLNPLYIDQALGIYSSCLKTNPKLFPLPKGIIPTFAYCLAARFVTTYIFSHTNC